MVNELARVSPYKVIAINSRSFMRIHLFFVVLCYGMLMTSCASYRSRYSNEAKEWEQTQLPTEKPSHTMYLIGDAGNDSPATPAPVLSYLKAVLDTASKNSSVLFMGDNIYEKGMAPKEDSVARSDGEYKILSQLKILDDYAGRPLFIPGNHDWNGWGLKGLNRQEKFVEEYLNNRHGEVDEDDWENYFLPD
jgi:hypothetical protein